jgi:SAM-dependent methyltransferase
MGADDAAAFFASGEQDIAATLARVRAMVGADFHPARALDFGCGVGRLTIPLARESRHVVAVDISPTMLAAARAHCAERDVTNVEFMDAGTFSRDSHRRRYDFVNSYIVFQHIRPRIGLRLTASILDMLSPGGVGALHYTYARRASGIRKVLNRARRWVPGMNVMANLVQRKSPFEPMIPMYEYRLAELFDVFAAHGCASLGVQLTDHGGHRGAMFFLQRQR